MYHGRMTPSPSVRHQVLAGRLYFEIERYLREHPGKGHVFFAPLDVLFTKWDVVEPAFPRVAELSREQSHVLTTQLWAATIRQWRDTRRSIVRQA